MVNLNGSSVSEKYPFEELAVVYVLFFDEAQGHVPLLIYPDDRYKNDKKFMRPIKYHPIWFLGAEDVLDHIDLEFKGYTFFGKRFLAKSLRKKRRAGLEEETPETIVIIVSLPNKIEIFGDDLIKTLTDEIRENFGTRMYEIIQAEILGDQVIKSPETKKIIEKGNKIKAELMDLIEKTSEHFFSDVIKQSDTTSIKMQKAISYLALKGIDIAHIASKNYKDSFSTIKLFDPNAEPSMKLNAKNKFSIKSINLMNDSQELEILVQNNTNEELSELTIKITHVKEYFEKEVLNEFIDLWFPKEKLLFISPTLPQINEYIFFILDENKKERLFSKRINLELINNQNS
ncbi:MAG: hypothetical protein ACFFD5_09170 [Candidatus Thorarchaeota archaeon]